MIFGGTIYHCHCLRLDLLEILWKDIGIKITLAVCMVCGLVAFTFWCRQICRPEKMLHPALCDNLTDSVPYCHSGTIYHPTHSDLDLPEIPREVFDVKITLAVALYVGCILLPAVVIKTGSIRCFRIRYTGGWNAVYSSRRYALRQRFCLPVASAHLRLLPGNVIIWLICRRITRGGTIYHTSYCEPDLRKTPRKVPDENFTLAAHTDATSPRAVIWLLDYNGTPL